MIIVGLENQTVFDVCLKNYGSLEGLKMLVEDNPDILTASIQGKNIKIRAAVINVTIVDYFAERQIVTY